MTSNETLKTMPQDAFAALGGGQIAYLRPVRSEEVHALFPQAPELAPGVALWALLSAAGQPIMLTDSKAAAIAWMESLRVELRGSGVSVVCVCPGYIDTPMTRVNRFRMPFLLAADDAAARIARVIAARRRLAVIPWQMAAVSVLLRATPGWLYDRLAARAPRKPRDITI